jgi:hypothetical protein
MAAKSIAMSTIKPIIHLHIQGKAIKEMIRATNLSRNNI